MITTGSPFCPGPDGARVAAGANGGAGGIRRHGDVRAHEQTQLHAGATPFIVCQTHVKTCTYGHLPKGITVLLTAVLQTLQVQDWVPGEQLLKSTRPFRPKTILQTASDLGR